MSKIKINRAILHVLDSAASMPMLSGGELFMNDELNRYIENHLEKVIDDTNIKKAQFYGDTQSNEIMFLCSELSANYQEFVAISAEIAKRLFEIMQKNVDIPSADLVCCIFEENAQKHLGILKLNYKIGFTHWVDNDEAGAINSIIRYQTLLPQDGQKLDECVLVNLEDLSIRLLEKAYEINGAKDFYLSNILLKCGCQLSDNAKMKIIDKVTKSINKKYYDEDFEKAIKLKKAVAESLTQSGEIHIEDVANKVYERDLGVQNEYVEKISQAGLEDKKITLPETVVEHYTEKKFKTHKIKTDTGIEINFPLEYADERDKIEFINNPDGTISIIIKNVGKISNK